MFDLEQSLVSHFVELGCSIQNVSISKQIYTDLSEVRKLFDVNYCFDDHMKRIYITAKISSSESEAVFFPVSTFEDISFTMMTEIINLRKNKLCYLSIISPDSTNVYYEINNGLTEFTSSGHVSKLKKTVKHDNEIFQKRDDIFQLVQ